MGEDILIMLYHLEFTSYLDFESLLEYVGTSKMNHTSTFPFLTNNTVLHVSLCFEQDVPQSFISYAKNAKKLSWYFTNEGNTEKGLFKYLPSLSITHLTLGGEFNTEVSEKCLPSSLTHLSFGDEFRQNVDNLPQNIVCLHFGVRFNKLVDKLPPNLQELYLYAEEEHPFPLLGRFSQDLNHIPPSLKVFSIVSDVIINLSKITFPPNLVKLKLDMYHPLDPLPLLPKSVKYLNLKNCGISLKNLPVALTHLKFNNVLDGSLNDLPHSLISIDFGFFNQKIEFLPPNLKYLRFGLHFNQTFTSLPLKLQLLHFGDEFTNSLSDLPTTLISLHLGREFSHDINFLPPNLKDLKFHLNPCRVGQKLKYGIFFPNSLQKLSLMIEETTYSPDQKMDIQKIVDNFPPSITNLILSCPLCNLDYLPPNLKTLSLVRCSNLTNIDNLPQSLTYLDLHGNCSISSYDHLPSSLTHLELDHDLPIDYLPENLTHLRILGEIVEKNYTEIDIPSSPDYFPTVLRKFYGNVDHLPSSLKYLTFGGVVGSGNPLCHLPQSLKFLMINQDNLSIENLPPSLKILDTWGTSQTFDVDVSSLQKLTKFSYIQTEGV